MINKIDTGKLEDYTSKLRSLHGEWNNYSKNMPDIGNNSGDVVDEITNLKASLQLIQDTYIQLLGHTVSYMDERKNSVDSKEDKATQVVRA